MVLPASGRIHRVNAGLRFVVIDYTLGGMPPMGSLVNVYRNNEKVGQLQGEPGGGAAVDDFDGANTLAIVVQVDKAVVTTGGPTLAVWASTHTKP